MAEINIAHVGNLVVLLIGLVAVYVLYKLWFMRKSVPTGRLVLAMIATLVAVFYSVGFAYAGEQKNDRAILSSTEQTCFKTRGLEYYIDHATYDCGSNVDARMNMTFDQLAPDRNDSGGTVVAVWALYAALICAIVLLPKKNSKKHSEYRLKR